MYYCSWKFNSEKELKKEGEFTFYLFSWLKRKFRMFFVAFLYTKSISNIDDIKYPVRHYWNLKFKPFYFQRQRYAVRKMKTPFPLCLMFFKHSHFFENLLWKKRTLYWNIYKYVHTLRLNLIKFLSYEPLTVHFNKSET